MEAVLFFIGAPCFAPCVLVSARPAGPARAEVGPVWWPGMNSTWPVDDRGETTPSGRRPCLRNVTAFPHGLQAGRRSFRHRAREKEGARMPNRFDPSRRV